MLWKRVIVGDQERVLIAKNGRFSGILEPGQHRIFVAPGVSLETEKHDVRDLVFGSKWADYLMKARPDLVNRYFTRVETNDVQVAMVYVDSKLSEVLLPAKRVLYWCGLAEVTAEVVDVVAQPEIPVFKLPALERLGRNSHAMLSVVDEAKTGLLFINNRLVRTLPPGKYGFWAVTGSPHVKVVDLRRQTSEVTGQEVLSRDKVALRVNLLSDYQVRDAVKAKGMAADFETHPYRLLEDNLILVRLKELETLEKLVEKADNLTAAGGFEDLLDQLIELKELPTANSR